MLACKNGKENTVWIWNESHALMIVVRSGKCLPTICVENKYEKCDSAKILNNDPYFNECTQKYYGRSNKIY